MHSVYRITNQLSQKVYIGKTNDPQKRWWTHKSNSKSDHPRSVIACAIKKYGVCNFVFEVLGVFLSEAEALDQEQVWIQRLNSNKSAFGYNLDGGGHGGKVLTPETRRKISLANKGRAKSDTARLKMSISAKGRDTALVSSRVASMRAANLGRPLAASTKLKISLANTGKSRTPEQLETLSQAHLGHKHSELSKAKIRASCKLAYAAKQQGVG